MIESDIWRRPTGTFLSSSTQIKKTQTEMIMKFLKLEGAATEKVSGKKRRREKLVDVGE